MGKEYTLYSTEENTMLKSKTRSNRSKQKQSRMWIIPYLTKHFIILLNSILATSIKMHIILTMIIGPRTLCLSYFTHTKIFLRSRIYYNKMISASFLNTLVLSVKWGAWTRWSKNLFCPHIFMILKCIFTSREGKEHARQLKDAMRWGLL